MPQQKSCDTHSVLLVGVNRIRKGTQVGFECTLSQTDLIVGPRGGSLPLLLYSVFHIGTANNNISYATYQHFTLIILESTLISAVGAIIGVAAAYAILFLVRVPVENNYGIPLAMVGISSRGVYCVIAAVGAGTLLGFIPAIRAYRNALVDGLNAG